MYKPGKKIFWLFIIVWLGYVIFGPEEEYYDEEESDPETENYYLSEEQAIPNVEYAEIVKNLDQEERVGLDSIYPCNSTQVFSKHKQGWQDFKENPYQETIRMSTQWACLSEQGRENFPNPPDDNYWGEVYTHLYKMDEPRLDSIYRVFENIKKTKNLSYEEFAYMLVSFVQSIPYILVHPGSCESYASYGGFGATYHRENRECLADKKFGLQSPCEFMYNFKGDCDTRALFAYAVLSHFKYDVVLYVSTRHAMLGINMRGHGNYLIHKGNKYYFWETTDRDWVIGAIPPSYQSDDWEIALFSQNPH